MTFDEVRDAYEEQVRGLIDGGADLLLLETIFDTLNAKAGIVAIENVFEEKGVRLPVMISVTITDRSGRTLSGQTLDAFYIVDPSRPAVRRRHQLRARRARDASVPRRARAARRVLRHSAIRTPGCRTRSASTTSSPTRPASCSASSPTSGFVNIVGGCCGTTPDHIRAIARRSKAGAAAAAGRLVARATHGDAAVAVHGPSLTRYTLLRPRDADHPARQQLPDDRRADQRHRLGEVRAPDQERQLHRRRCRSRSSRSAAAPTSSTSTWTRACSTPSRR